VLTKRNNRGPAPAIDRIAIGKSTESAAETFLEKQGLVSLHRNFRCRMGEIDLIMRDGEMLVFVEVRFRRPGQHGDGAGSITYAKRQKLVRCAGYYLGTRRISSHQKCRFDVVSVGQKGSAGHADYEFAWIRAAFQSDT
jgi:putative endonuclease